MTPFFTNSSKFLRSNSGPFPSGDNALDEMLSGGFERGSEYLLFGDKKLITNILLTVSVNVQKSETNGGMGEDTKVAFIDGNNRFNPYYISKYAVSQNLSPQKVLENILICRAFSLDKLPELFEYQDMKVILISGIDSFFDSVNKKNLEKIFRIVEEIKGSLSISDPLIILTAFSFEDSLSKSREMESILHFGNVVVMINDDERFVEYFFLHHPYLSKKRFRKWKPEPPNIKITLRQTTLDSWI